MTKRMTTQQLEAIRKRAGKATEGPWEISELGDTVTSIHADTVNFNGATNDVCQLFDGEYIENANSESDTEFIAHSREDIPALLAEVERLRGINEFLANVISWNVSCAECSEELGGDSVVNE